jgi:hypothetical protein
LLHQLLKLAACWHLLLLLLGQLVLLLVLLLLPASLG